MFIWHISTYVGIFINMYILNGDKFIPFGFFFSTCCCITKIWNPNTWRVSLINPFQTFFLVVTFDNFLLACLAFFVIISRYSCFTFSSKIKPFIMPKIRCSYVNFYFLNKKRLKQITLRFLLDVLALLNTLVHLFPFWINYKYWVISSKIHHAVFFTTIPLLLLKATFCIQILAISHLSRNRYSFQILCPFWWDHLIG